MSDPISSHDPVDYWTKATGLDIRKGNRVDYLIDGWTTFESMYEAINTTFSKADGSAFYIYLLGWWLDDTIPLKQKEPDSSLYKLFQKAASYNVQLRMMLWKNIFKTALEGLNQRQNKPQIDRVNLLATGAGILDDNTLKNGSQHQKVLIVKGKYGLIGFCGGIDISKDRVQTVPLHPGSPFHDVHCRIEGDAVHDLVDIFLQRWQSHPQSKELDAKKGQLRGLRDGVPLCDSQKPIGSQHVGIGRTFNFVGKGKQCAKEISVQSAMIGAIRAAKLFIYIEDQYLVNQDAAVELQKVLKKIQYLIILIPHTSITDLPRAWEARARFIEILRKDPKTSDKVQVFYRFTPGKHKETPQGDKAFGPHSYVHAKTWIFDDELAVIGSANCNRRGWQYDSEVIAAIADTFPSTAKGPSGHSFAQNLRMALWAEHLGVDPSFVVNALASAPLWYKAASIKDNTVQFYNPYEKTDRDELSGWIFAPIMPQGSWDWILDPASPVKFPMCPEAKRKCL